MDQNEINSIEESEDSSITSTSEVTSTNVLSEFAYEAAVDTVVSDVDQTDEEETKTNSILPVVFALIAILVIGVLFVRGKGNESFTPSYR